MIIIPIYVINPEKLSDPKNQTSSTNRH